MAQSCDDFSAIADIIDQNTRTWCHLMGNRNGKFRDSGIVDELGRFENVTSAYDLKRTETSKKLYHDR